MLSLTFIPFWVAQKGSPEPLAIQEAGEEKDSRPRVSWEEVLSDKAGVCQIVNKLQYEAKRKCCQLQHSKALSHIGSQAAVLDVVDVDVVRLGKSEAMVTSIEVLSDVG